MWSPFSWDTFGHLSALRRTEKVGGLRDAALRKFLWSHRHMVYAQLSAANCWRHWTLDTCFWDHKGCDNFLSLVTLVTNKWLWFANGFYNSCALEFLNFSPSFLQFLGLGFDLQGGGGAVRERGALMQHKHFSFLLWLDSKPSSLPDFLEWPIALNG